MMKRALMRAAVISGIPAAVLAAGRRRLRVLEYHGVCPDALAREPWVPAYFVSASRFREQMGYLRRRLRPLPLGEAVHRLRQGTLPPGAVAVTFDDGYANNLHEALPILAEHAIPATIYLATHYVETGALFPYDRIRLLRDFWRRSGLPERPGACAMKDYLTRPLDEVEALIDRDWREAGAEPTKIQRETLRPLRRDELGRFDSSLLSFGAHTHRHCILRNESRERRNEEIRRSVQLAREWTGARERLFSYPNGQPGDFDEADKAALREAGVESAVSCRRGSNPPGSDPLELRRFSIGIHHDLDIFRIEISGLRVAALRLLGRQSRV
ncbi:MAG: polysaccharide deacetylase family protein [Planctomycetaceae bacterium]